MLVKILAGTTNVLRFPVERRARPTLDVMRSLAPDRDEMLAIAVVFGVDLVTLNLRAAADANAAECIRGSAATNLVTSESLDGLLDPEIVAAITASWAARDLSAATTEACQAYVQAQASGEGWLAPLRERADALQLRAVDSLIKAHTRAEQVEGIARAVGYARRGEVWTPQACDQQATASLSASGRRSGYKSTVRTPGRRRTLAGITKADLFDDRTSA